MKTLIVDDHAIMRKMLRSMLDPSFSLLEAENGQEALKQIGANSDIQLILTDFNMPVMNGLQMLEAIRSTHPQFKPHIIFISSNRDRALIDKAATLGVNMWLHKPFKKEDLLAVLQTLK